MSESRDQLERRLPSFRPLGEAQAMERALGVFAQAAAADAELRRRLLVDPRAVLAEYGLQVPDALRLEVLEERPGEVHLVLPVGELEENEYAPAALQILKRARQDAAFADNLMKQPRSIFEATLGYSLPPALQIGIHRNSVDQFHLVLPSQRPSGELSDADLDMVAGGACSFRMPKQP